MHVRSCATLAVLLVTGCVPSGSAGPQDSKGTPGARGSLPTVAPGAAMPSPDTMKTPFQDDFDRPVQPTAPAVSSASPTAPGWVEPGPDWMPTVPGIWHIEGGRLCGEHARNHGVWLKRVLPVNARIEFDAISQSPDGDLKAEYWGDGRSYATALSYTNATSYLTIFGGWHNKFHVLARINEHGGDRKEIIVNPNSEDPREKPVVPGQSYHFKVERTDGRTLKWSIDGIEMLTYPDPQPLEGVGHDHLGFNDWDAKVCFDNLKVVPLP